MGHALFAHRVSTSSVTGYTPFYLTYGRRPRVPVRSMLRDLEVSDPCVVGDRLQGLATAFQDAVRRTKEARDSNRKRLEERATAHDVQVGDTVVLRINTAIQFQQKWRPEYEVIRVTGPVLKCRHQQSGQIRTVNRRHARIVPRDLVWDLPPTPLPARPRQREYLSRGAKRGPIRYEDDPNWEPDERQADKRVALKRRGQQEGNEVSHKRRHEAPATPPPEEESPMDVEFNLKRTGDSLTEDGPSTEKRQDISAIGMIQSVRAVEDFMRKTALIDSQRNISRGN